MGEIANGRALAQEFGIGADDDIKIRPELAQPSLDLAASADRHGRFRCDDGRAIEMRRHFAHRLEDVGEIGITVATAHRSAHGEENDVGSLHSLRKETRKPQAPGRQIARYKLVQPRLIYGNNVPVQLGDAVLVLVDTSDGPPKIGKTGCGHQADIAGTNHADFQGSLQLRAIRSSPGDRRRRT